jgi:hypothetical protein
MHNSIWASMLTLQSLSYFPFLLHHHRHPQEA